MKNILCYGDSNTWGYNPVTGGQRHKFEDRWTTILGNLLGENINIIPEGLNGRTTVWDDPIKSCVNGKEYFKPCLESHKPLDLVIIFLGTNDLKKRLNLPACDIAAGVGVLVDTVLNSDYGVGVKPPKVLILIPPKVEKLSNFKGQFGDCIKVSMEFPREFKKIADEKCVDYLDIGKSVRFSDVDGIHFEVDQLDKLASIIFNKLSTIINL